MPRSCEAAHEDSKVEAQRGEIHHIATDHGPMVQGGLLTAHPGSVHGDGKALGGESSLRQGAGTASPGCPDLETMHGDPEFIGHFKYWENLKYKNCRKQELALRCT